MRRDIDVYKISQIQGVKTKPGSELYQKHSEWCAVILGDLEEVFICINKLLGLIAGL